MGPLPLIFVPACFSWIVESHLPCETPKSKLTKWSHYVASKHIWNFLVAILSYHKTITIFHQPVPQLVSSPKNHDLFVSPRCSAPWGAPRYDFRIDVLTDVKLPLFEWGTEPFWCETFQKKKTLESMKKNLSCGMVCCYFWHLFAASVFRALRSGYPQRALPSLLMGICGKSSTPRGAKRAWVQNRKSLSFLLPQFSGCFYVSSEFWCILNTQSDSFSATPYRPYLKSQALATTVACPRIFSLEAYHRLKVARFFNLNILNCQTKMCTVNFKTFGTIDRLVATPEDLGFPVFSFIMIFDHMFNLGDQLIQTKMDMFTRVHAFPLV